MSAKLLLHEEVSVPEAILRVLEEAGIDTIFGKGLMALSPRLIVLISPGLRA